MPRNILNTPLPLDHLQRLRDPAQIHAPAVSADFATDAARAQLVRDRRVGLERELHGAALAAAFEGPVGGVSCGRGCGCGHAVGCGRETEDGEGEGESGMGEAEVLGF